MGTKVMRYPRLTALASAIVTVVTVACIAEAGSGRWPASGGGGGGVTSAVAGTGISVSGATGAVTFTNTAPFGADTQVDINNGSGTPVHALQVTNSLTTATAGSEASKWVIKLLSAGAQTTALDLRPTQMLSPDGSVSAPAWAFGSQTGTGFYRDPANASISWANSGALGGLLKNGVVWIYDSAGIFQIGSGFDTSMRRSANGLELRTFTNGNLVFGVATSNNASFFDAAPGYNSGQNVIAVKNRAAAPTGNYATGGYLYAEGGALMWRGSSGTVTTVAPP